MTRIALHNEIYLKISLVVDRTDEEAGKVRVNEAVEKVVDSVRGTVGADFDIVQVFLVDDARIDENNIGPSMPALSECQRFEKAEDGKPYPRGDCAGEERCRECTQWKGGE